jgi:hypothetical protein
MNISEIDFRRVVFPLERELLDVCDGDIEEFKRLIDTIGKMTFREDFSFCDIDRLITANKGYKKDLKRSALNDRFLERILPAIKKYETCKDTENKPIYLKVLKNELHNTHWENINEEDLIYGSYAGQMLDSLLPMREMNVRVRFNEELENLKTYIVEKIKSRHTDYPSVGEER